jgi:hypothetical protein
MSSSAIAGEPGMAEEVTQVYSDVLAPVAAVFFANHEAVATAETHAAKKKLAVEQSLATFDSVYRAARSVVLAYEPATTLPDTLKVQNTQMDVLYALTTLVKVIKTHAGETWADKLMAGRFGTLAPKVEGALNESIAAGSALAAARKERVIAFGACYKAFLSFKRVVRDTLGASSIQYRRLHPRSAAKAMELDEDEAAPDSGVMPASSGTLAQANGSSQAKAG